MVQINFALKEINCKLVYYGPGRSGKTTNLEQVHQKAPEDSKGELVSINTETDRTLYFDFLPLNLGKVAGMTTKFQLYTVPGQVYYNATRKLVLQGVDGVVFVADSSPHMMDENLESLENMLENLRDNGIDTAVIPIVLQLNKRDVDGALDKELMVEKLKRGEWAVIEACAFKGEGVFPTLKKLAGMVIAKLNDQDGYAKSSQAPESAPVVAAVAPTPAPIAPVVAAKVEAPKPTPVAQPAPVQKPTIAPTPTPPVVAKEEAPKPAQTPAPVAPTSSVPKKEESKSDLIAVRLAKMRAEKATDEPSQTVSSQKETPRKLPSKGFIGFIKKLFGKG
jgi:signal recognition particle receptor subunit beta